VLWSKDFSKLMSAEAYELIDPLNPYFIFTVNSCPDLERGLAIPLEDRLEQAAVLVERYGQERLLWRFDPIVHWMTPEGEERDNTAPFERIARAMAALGVTRCAFSFVQIYGKVTRRISKLDIDLVDPPLERKLEILKRMAALAGDLGIRMLSCCQPELLGAHPNVTQSSCIDGPRIAEALGIDGPLPDMSPHPSREGCGCTRSVDIGQYEPCPHACVYCYANPSMG